MTRQEITPGQNAQDGTAYTVFTPSAEAYANRFSDVTIGYRVSEEAILYAMEAYFSERISQQTPFTLLEIGAGTGQATRRMMNELDRNSTWYTLTSTEPNARMIQAGEGVNRLAAASDNLARAIPPDTQTPAENLSHFPDRTFDIVFGSQVIHWIDDLPRAFQEANRVLKPGGMIIHAGSGIIAGERMLDDTHFTRHPSYQQFLRNIQRQLEQNGLWDKSTGEFAPTNPQVNPLFHRYDVAYVQETLANTGFTNVTRTYHRASINEAEMLLRMSAGNVSMFLFSGVLKDMSDQERTTIVDKAREKIIQEHRELLEVLNTDPAEDSTLLFTAKKAA